MSEVVQAPARAPGLWASVWKLLRMRLLLTWSGFRRAKPRQKIFQVFFILILAAIATGAFVLSQALIRFLSSPGLTTQINLTSLFSSLPALVLSIAFFINLITNFGVLLQALYLSRDMDFLIVAPLPMRAVFISKLVQAILPGFGLFCLFGIPLLFGLGAASGYNLAYYPMVVIVLAFLALASAGIASILVMAIVRVVPPRRVAEVLGFVGAIVSILFSQAGNLMGSFDINGDQFSAALTRFAGLAPVWSPFTWAGRGLSDIGGGQWLSGIGLTLLTLIAAGGLFAVTLSAAQQLYYTGWAGLQTSAQKKKTQPKRKTIMQRQPTRKGIFPQAFQAIIIKDFLLLRRDLRNLSQLITPLIFGFVMVLSSSRSMDNEPFGSELPFSDLQVYSSIGFTMFVGWMLIMSLASTAMSREGRNYWLLNVAPVQPSQLLWAKYTISFLPTLVIGWFFMAITATIRSTSLNDLGYMFIVSGLCLAGLNGILLAFGITSANMEWEDVRRVGLRSGAGCLSLLACLAYFVIALGLFFLPPVLWEILQIGNLWIGRGIGLVVGAAFTLACAVLLPLSTRKRIPLLGQPRA